MKYYILSICLLICFSAFAQPVNDECTGAIPIPDVNNWCSPVGAYTNVGSTPSLATPANCLINNSHDVWFSFVAVAPNLNVSVVGNASPISGGSLIFPEVAIYSGTCGSLTMLECRSDALGVHVIDQFATGLQIGETYYILVDGRNNFNGTFELCVNSFNPVPEPSSDCITGVILCDKSSFTLTNISGNGVIPNEIDGPTCTTDTGCDYGEYNSVWYKWTCDMSGSLTFELTPLNPSDDLDFWVFELPNGIQNCNNKIPLRCMTSGENQGAPLADWVACTGATGLAAGDPDDHENCGCQPGNNNYVAPINMVSGKSYALVIENFSGVGNLANNGVTVEFGGSGTFLGPEAAFETSPDFTFGTINNICWNTIEFVDATILGVSPLVGWEWNFGADAAPATASGPGPHAVDYLVPGPKSITLTVESQLGCLTTEIASIYVDPCCGDGQGNGWSLGMTATVTDVTCPFADDGAIQGSLSGSHQPFDIVWNNGQTTPAINNLPPDNYEYTITDFYGCTQIGDFDVIGPPEPVIQIDIVMPTCDGGTDGEINVSVTGPAPPYQFNWDNTGFTSNSSITNLPVSVHDLIIRDDVGCEFPFNLDVRELELELDPSVQLITPVSCTGGSDGAVTVVIANGLPPYSYDWNDGNGFVTSNSLNNIPAGSYSVLVRDANGCLGDFSPIILDDPLPLGISTTPIDVSCFGDTDGVVSSMVTGGTPGYTYVWSNNGTTPDVSSLAPGVYEVTVTDANGCVITTSDIVGEPDPVYITDIEVLDNDCFGGTDGGLIVTAEGGSRPFTYSIDGSSFQMDSIFTGLPTGTYNVVVRDIFDCDVEQEATISEPFEILVDARYDTIIDLGYSVGIQAIINTSDAHTYSWTPSESLTCDDCFEPDAMPFVTTTYVVTVETYLGCIATDSVTVTINPVRPVYIPNAFTPNFDGINDNFLVFGSPAVSQVRRLDVYSRWGNHVFHSENVAPNDELLGWDGNFNGRPLNPGVFVYLAEVEFLDGEVKQYSGDVTLIK